MRWSLFFLNNPFGTLGNQSFSHILGLKWGTSIFCVIQDGGSHVGFFVFLGESRRGSEKLKVPKLLTSSHKLLTAVSRQRWTHQTWIKYRSKRSFWKNEEVTNEGLKLGCLLKYRVVRGKEQFIFHRIAGTKLQVSFHYYTNSTVVSRFLRNLHCPSVLEGLEPPPPLLIWAPLQNFLFFNFLSIRSLFSFFVFCFFVKTSPYYMSIPVNNLNFIAYSTHWGQSQDKQ